MRAILVAAAVLSTSFAAHADFVGFGCIRHVVTGDLHRYHIMEVYAAFDDPTDRVLNIFDVSATLSNDSDPSAVPEFFQAEDPDSELPPSFMPLGYLPPGEAWRFDSYVTIGAVQGNMLNGTILDPSFSDHKFVQQHAITDNAGWFNLPPTNGYGLAGDGLKVLVGVFVVTDEHYAAGLRLNLEATLGFADGNTLRFATASRTLKFPSAETPAYSADRIDGDGNSDIVFHNPGSGRLALWLMQGLTRKSGTVLGETAPAGHALQGMGDLDADGVADLVWRDQSGRFDAWLMGGGSVALEAPMSTPIGSDWVNIAIGDVSGDARADIVLRNTATGDVRVWLMDGFIRVAEGTIGNAAGLACEALADFNGDGTLDLLWRSESGVLRMWLLDGLEVVGHGEIANAPAVMAPHWTIAGAGDLDGDARADIVWRNTTSGSVTSWQMDGMSRASGGTIHQGISLDWRIDAVRDLNGDGRSDIVWRRMATGDVNGWLMNGRTRLGGGFIRNAQLPWSVVLP
jgi:hypothetical protein